MTRKEKDYLRDVAQLSCIACRINNQTTTPVEVHHQRSGTGLGRKASHFDTLPLCPLHHRFSTYDSVHLAPETFRKLYGRESDLVKQTQTDVENYRKTFVGYVGGGLTMYRALEQALLRIFGVPELMMNNARWQRDINTGYRQTSVNPVASTRDERLGEDGVYQGYLRQRMTPELHDILTIRYDEDHSKRVSAFQRLQHHFRTDERLPKPFRSNPVLLRLWLMHELKHPQLRQHKGRVTIKDKGESTVYRWQQKCRTVCCEWVRLAEDEAQALLEQAGVIQYGE